MAKRKGKDLQFMVEGKTIAYSTGCSLNTTTQIVDSKTKDDAVGPAGEFDYVDWNGSSENVLGFNDGVTAETVYSDLMDLQLEGTKINVRLCLVDGASGAIPQGGWKESTTPAKDFAPYGGLALIESVNLNAPAEGNATVSVNFKGVGPLKKLTAQTTQQE